MRYFLFTLLLVSTSAVAQLNAGFSASVTQGCSVLTVGFNDQSTGSPTKWFWDFGNGLTSVAENPTVDYYTPGIYTVRLIVKNATAQDYEEKTNYIRVLPAPPPGFTTNIDSGCVPLQVLFTDTTDISNINVRSWLWNYGDGTTSSQQNPQHVFTTERNFDVSLTIETTDGCRNTIQKTGVIRTGSRPVADFTASPLNGCASTIRSFNNISTAGITSSSWDFGDGVTSNEESPMHHFQDTGWLTVKLTVTKNGCKDTVEKIDYIYVSGPVARINKIVSCEDSLTLGFRDHSIGEENINWDLGDGTTSTTKTTIHTYATTGDYIVTLSVTHIAVIPKKNEGFRGFDYF